MRLKDPVRYAELAGRLIMAVQEPADPNNFANCDTEQDIARKLLHQVGVSEEALTPDMVERAEAANDELLQRLLVIAEGN